MTMELLELRLRSLERRNARLKLVVLLVAVLAVGAILTNVSENLWADTPAVQDTVRANRIEVVDTDGKLLAVLGKLTGDEFHTTAGLSLISNEKQVAQLAQTTYRDGSSGGAELRVFNPKDEKQLFSAGVGNYSGGVGLLPVLELNQRDSKFGTRLDPSGLNVYVKIAELENSSAAAISLYAKENHSATLMLGGSKPFKVRAIAESDKPRFEVENGEGKNRKITTYGLAQPKLKRLKQSLSRKEH